MSTTTTAAVANDIEDTTHLVSVLLLRTPVPTSQGTDPYHDAFGSFCLPSFADSALESGTSTPLPGAASIGPLSTATDPSAVDLIKTALAQTTAAAAAAASATASAATASSPSSSSGLPTSPTGRRKGKFIQDTPRLMTHHLSFPLDERQQEHEIEYCVTSFPILSHDLVNTDALADRLLKGHPDPHDPTSRTPYRGVIVTSQRAVEAYVAAGQRAYQSLRSQGRSTSDSPTLWTRIPFFAVGPATATALRNVPLAPWLRPRLVMGGEATGTGEALANYVIRHFSSPSLIDHTAARDPMASVVPQPLAASGVAASSSSSSSPSSSSATAPAPQPEPILYLVGDKNAPTIPTLLSSPPPPSQPIPFEELQVYETGPDRHFHEGCAALAKSLPTVISRPVSRRPSSGSFSSRPGSRRPSGSGSRTPNPAGASSDAAETASTAVLDEARKPLSHNYVPSVGTPLGVSTMTPAATASSGQSSSSSSEGAAAAAAAKKATQGAGIEGGGAGSTMLPSAAQVASPATLNPEPMNPLEEDAILKALRNKTQGRSSSTSSAAAAASEATGKPPSRMAEAKPDWIVFFSPSGVGYALDEFRRRKWLPPPPIAVKKASPQSSGSGSGSGDSAGAGGSASGAPAGPAANGAASDVDKEASPGQPSNAAAKASGDDKDQPQPQQRATTTVTSQAAGRRRYPRIAVIGPTTRNWIVENLGVEPDAVAAKPGPKELKEAIERVEVRVKTGTATASASTSPSSSL
ncbi:uncharacterized protein PFL1_05977 [Pseudozyma flocculosa PF-1]|uniref:Related to HEM4 - Uroporphyrinogen III synthase n=2 Tax=Pseudozyma flocculosa TaxID=84751 RepID=A0A5C3F5Z6_9BASI|nr:uncharacterized protein PFL1_05977 [Pseudozyma flocculosa PF-1]EPQ26328.1 hypothetical protein PFL1_05977 [Pseudozyma flocculosa PF-1]SPO39087.1 related to HEM4 - Uroporphyrinogen III synthase [Pseudozyma flocculosa]